MYRIFYYKLEDIQNYHKNNPDAQPAASEAQHVLENIDIDKLVRFTDEEGYGKYLDLHVFFDKFINLNGVNNDIGYVTYLDIFYTFQDKFVIIYKRYKDYLQSLEDYLIDFLKRAYPLNDYSEPLK